MEKLETKDTEVIELKDEELGTITAGLGTRKDEASRPERKPVKINTLKEPQGQYGLIECGNNIKNI